MTRSYRQPVLITVASLVPISYFLFPFLCGFCNLSQVNLMLLIPIILFGSVFVGITVASLFRNTGMLSRVGIGFISSVISVALSFLFPASAKTWTVGFSSNFQMTKHPREVQRWAVTVLERYQAGQLNISTNAPYWAVGKAKLDPSEVPSAIDILWRNKPSIGIAEVASDGWLTALTDDPAGQEKSMRCVAFSWYLSGILVGPPDFHCTWNPWYIREIAPGIYAYCGMK